MTLQWATLSVSRMNEDDKSAWQLKSSALKYQISMRSIRKATLWRLIINSFQMNLQYFRFCLVLFINRNKRHSEFIDSRSFPTHGHISDHHDLFYASTFANRYTTLWEKFHSKTLAKFSFCNIDQVFSSTFLTSNMLNDCPFFPRTTCPFSQIYLRFGYW